MILAMLGTAIPQADLNQKEAKYTHNIQKKEEKEKYERKKMNHNPSGYMKVEEYELLSAPKDKMLMDVPVPKVPTPSDMLYVPQPAYKIIRYNDPPGSPELTISKTIYQTRQKNAQGIVSPDFTKLVYPSIYYYPNSGSVACDLFVIELQEAKSNLDKILTANTMHRKPDPIMSTEKTNDNYYITRTLTPVDFSADGSKLLVKEKIGNTKDGIWKTTPYIYDFENNVSYSLEDVREAISYYWRDLMDLNLRDKRWDIYPLGFSIDNLNIVVVNAFAYTGGRPINLGTWAIDTKGENVQRLSLINSNIQIAMNGYKLIKDGVVSPTVTEREEKFLKKIDKSNIKKKKAEEKTELKELKKSYEAKIKEMNAEFKESQKDYNIRKKINSSTTENDGIEKYKQIKAEQELKKQLQLEKQQAKELKLLEKNKNKK